MCIFHLGPMMGTRMNWQVSLNSSASVCVTKCRKTGSTGALVSSRFTAVPLLLSLSKHLQKAPGWEQAMPGWGRVSPLRAEHYHTVVICSAALPGPKQSTETNPKYNNKKGKIHSQVGRQKSEHKTIKANHSWTMGISEEQWLTIDSVQRCPPSREKFQRGSNKEVHSLLSCRCTGVTFLPVILIKNRTTQNRIAKTEGEKDKGSVCSLY